MIKRLKKYISIFLIATALTTCFIRPMKVKANPQEVVQATQQIAPAAGPLAPFIVIGGLLVAGGVAVYEILDAKIPRLPQTSEPNSILEKKDSNGKVIQIRYYDNNGKPAIDIDLNDHGMPKEHPWGIHKHIWEGGKRNSGQGLTEKEARIYLDGSVS